MAKKEVKKAKEVSKKPAKPKAPPEPPTAKDIFGEIPGIDKRSLLDVIERPDYYLVVIKGEDEKSATNVSNTLATFGVIRFSGDGAGFQGDETVIGVTKESLKKL